LTCGLDVLVDFENVFGSENDLDLENVRKQLD
jgi:hypothetical protein